MTQENECRRAFEEWINSQPNKYDKPYKLADGSYYCFETDNAWESWQSAWKARGEHDGK